MRLRAGRVTGISVIVFGLLAAGVVEKAHSEAIRLTTNPTASRKVPKQTPADYHLTYVDAGVTTTDGLKLVGWYMPGTNGATVIFVHGYKDSRGNMLGSAAMFHAHGYGTLLIALRGHDRSDGDRVTFGHDELRDLDAWYGFAVRQPNIDRQKIAILGVSMGGAIAIQYAAKNPAIAALVADSAFSSMDDTIATSVRHFTGLPPFPFASLIGFWIREDTGLTRDEADAKRAIARISPRPVFLMQGGADTVISPQSGQLLYDAAKEPKALWFDPALDHAKFFDQRRDEYERRVIGFMDRYVGKR
jgi:fermentation-respiration switch protein FrsA (DUF1100 family)